MIFFYLLLLSFHTLFIIQSQTVIIVIDALDECEKDADIGNIVQLLPLVQEANTIRIRIFLTSRPELPIHLGFSHIANHNYQNLALHEISEEVTEQDILCPA